MQGNISLAVVINYTINTTLSLLDKSNQVIFKKQNSIKNGRCLKTNQIARIVLQITVIPCVRVGYEMVDS